VIVPEQAPVLVLFQAGTTSLQSSLGTVVKQYDTKNCRDRDVDVLDSIVDVSPVMRAAAGTLLNRFQSSVHNSTYKADVRLPIFVGRYYRTIFLVREKSYDTACHTTQRIDRAPNVNKCKHGELVV